MPTSELAHGAIRYEVVEWNICERRMAVLPGNEPGCYEIWADGALRYIGSSLSPRERLLTLKARNTHNLASEFPVWRIVVRRFATELGARECEAKRLAESASISTLRNKQTEITPVVLRPVVPSAAAKDQGPLKVLTVEQAAAALQVSPAVMRSLLRTERISGRKVGRDWRLRECDVIAFAQGAQEEPKEAVRQCTISTRGKTK